MADDDVELGYVYIPTDVYVEGYRTFNQAGIKYKKMDRYTVLEKAKAKGYAVLDTICNEECGKCKQFLTKTISPVLTPDKYQYLIDNGIIVYYSLPPRGAGNWSPTLMRERVPEAYLLANSTFGSIKYPTGRLVCSCGEAPFRDWDLIKTLNGSDEITDGFIPQFIKKYGHEIHVKEPEPILQSKVVYTFSANGDILAVKTMNYPTDNTPDPPIAPAYPGYTFNRWVILDTYETYKANTPVADHNITVVAAYIATNDIIIEQIENTTNRYYIKQVKSSISSTPFKFKTPSAWQYVNTTTGPAGQIEQIGDSAFKGVAKMTSIDLPNNINKLGNDVFSGCTSLAIITILNPYILVGTNCFTGCTSLNTIIYNGSAHDWNNNPTLNQNVGKVSFETESADSMIGKVKINNKDVTVLFSDIATQYGVSNQHFFPGTVYRDEDDFYSIQRYASAIQFVDDIQSVTPYFVLYVYSTSDVDNSNLNSVLTSLEYRDYCREKKILTYFFTDTRTSSEIAQNEHNIRKQIKTGFGNPLHEDQAGAYNPILLAYCGSDSTPLAQTKCTYGGNMAFNQLKDYIENCMVQQNYTPPTINSGDWIYVYTPPATQPDPEIEGGQVITSFDYGETYTAWRDFFSLISFANTIMSPVFITYSAENCIVCDDFAHILENISPGLNFKQWLIDNRILHFHYRNPLRQGDPRNDDRILCHPIKQWIDANTEFIPVSSFDEKNKFPTCAIYIPTSNKS